MEYPSYRSIGQKRSGEMMRKNLSMFCSSVSHAACIKTRQSDGNQFLKAQTKFQVSGEINSLSSGVRAVPASVLSFRTYSVLSANINVLDIDFCHC